MKKVITYIVLSAILSLTVCGCKCDECGGGDKPVAPSTFSSEGGDTSEPSLPYMKPWWKN